MVDTLQNKDKDSYSCKHWLRKSHCQHLLCFLLIFRAERGKSNCIVIHKEVYRIHMVDTTQGLLTPDVFYGRDGKHTSTSLKPIERFHFAEDRTGWVIHPRYSLPACELLCATANPV